VTAEDPEEVAVNFLVTTFEILVEKMDEKRILAAKLLIVLHIVAVNKRIKQDGIIQYQLMLAIRNPRFEKKAPKISSIHSSSCGVLGDCQIAV